MKSIHFSRPLSCLLCWVLLSFSPLLYAEPAPSEGLTQGEAAVVLATRLGLFTASTEAPNQTTAIQLLAARGISPAGGWDADGQLTPGSLARMLVQALGLEQELSEAEQSGDDDAPFIDLLIEEFGVDVEAIVASKNLSDNSLAALPQTTSPDPLTSPTESTTETAPRAVSRSNLNDTLAAIIGGSGSGGGGTSGSPSGAAPP